MGGKGHPKDIRAGYGQMRSTRAAWATVDVSIQGGAAAPGGNRGYRKPEERKKRMAKNGV